MESRKFTNITKLNRLNPILKVIFQGVLDMKSPLSLLRGIPHVIQVIWNDINSYSKKYMKKLGFFNRFEKCWSMSRFDLGLICKFPAPIDLNINMMPFTLHSSFAKSHLPQYLKNYWEDFIRKCIRSKEIGKVGYLTIHEGAVVKRKTLQGQAGIHIESPSYSGGIYMASSMEDSCRVWNCQILRSNDGTDIVGEHGNVEQLRGFLPVYELMKKNTLYWITDRTPHEFLPAKKTAYMQFFRLVTSNLSLWCAKHSTRNPLGVVPDKTITKIVKGSTCYCNKVASDL